jgi:hypothetical protein
MRLFQITYDIRDANACSVCFVTSACKCGPSCPVTMFCDVYPSVPQNRVLQKTVCQDIFVF